MKCKYKIFAIPFLLLLGACSVNVSQPTTQLKQDPNEITINQNFDDTWEDMVEYISTSYFGIESFEKDSGLLTLSFGAENPGRYIDCGMISGPNFKGQTTEVGNLGRGAYHQLEGRMNVFINSQNPNVTTVRVTARYVYTLNDGAFNQVWAFNTNTSDTKSLNAANGITCLSKQVAEQELIEGIRLMSSKNKP